MNFKTNDEKREENTFSQLDHSENIMTSCCSNTKTDRRLIVVSAQVGFSAITLFFCFFMVSKKNDTEDIGTFYAIISSVLSFWLGKSTDI